MTWAIHQGDALELLRSMPEASFHCCVTSPPYWGLRDYGTATWEGGQAYCEHRGRPKPRQDTSGGGPNKGRFAASRGTQAGKRAFAIHVRDVCRCGARRVDKQLGLEASPDLYVERLVEILAEVRRVLREDGTLWLNLGDCYLTAPHGKSSAMDPKWPEARNRGEGWGANRRPVRGLKPKDLIGIPWRVAFALQADGWWLRSDVIWHKPNPMPESVTDRPTKAHEYLFLLSKSERYHYDAAAIAEQASVGDHPRNGTPGFVQQSPGQPVQAGFSKVRSSGNKARKYRGDHGGVSEDLQRGHQGFGVPWTGETRNKRSVWTVATRPYSEAHFATFPPQLVEPCVLASCPRGGRVLDPFAGAGTTLLVATRLGRDSEGIELNPEYAAMARRRITQDAPLFNTQEVTA